MKISLKYILTGVALAVSAAAPAVAQGIACPDKSVQYMQAFPPGGESDISARHQQRVLKGKCPAIDTVIQYKAGAGGALLWNQFNQLAADGVTVGGVNLPHIVFQPLEGQVQYKTSDITPVYWFHYTPDAIVVPAQSAIKDFKDFVATAKAQVGKLSLGGSGQNSANHAAHERMNAAFGVKTSVLLSVHCHLPGIAGFSTTPGPASLPVLSIGAAGREKRTTSGTGTKSLSGTPSAARAGGSHVTPTFWISS